MKPDFTFVRAQLEYAEKHPGYAAEAIGKSIAALIRELDRITKEYQK